MHSILFLSNIIPVNFISNKNVGLLSIISGELDVKNGQFYLIQISFPGFSKHPKSSTYFIDLISSIVNLTNDLTMACMKTPWKT